MTFTQLSPVEKAAYPDHNPIINFSGKTGAGKTAYMDFMADVLGFPRMKSLTTRPLDRGEEDFRTYNRVQIEEILRWKDEGYLSQYIQFPPDTGHHYGSLYDECNAKTVHSPAVYSTTQEGIIFLRQNGYRVLSVKVVPRNSGEEDRGDPKRKTADLVRDLIPVEWDCILENDFNVGLEESMRKGAREVLKALQKKYPHVKCEQAFARL